VIGSPERAALLRDLHRPGAPLVLFNVWDAGSARAVARAGARAIATGSWSVAAAHGHDDGERLPLDLVLANLERIVAAVDLPVTLDFEGGYGADPEAVAGSVARALERGAVGFNLEDGIDDGERLRTAEEQVARLGSARAACRRLGIPAFLNARTDLFLQPDRRPHDAERLGEALARAAAYARAGADGLFVPGLLDEELLGRLCAASPLPVNALWRPGAPAPARLASLGVARISYGPWPYRAAMRALEEAARAALSTAAPRTES
jgi:2-methylisocitrate lyase-like PEP mutase family enzyme